MKHPLPLLLLPLPLSPLHPAVVLHQVLLQLEPGAAVQALGDECVKIYDKYNDIDNNNDKDKCNDKGKCNDKYLMGECVLPDVLPEQLVAAEHLGAEPAEEGETHLGWRQQKLRGWRRENVCSLNLAIGKRGKLCDVDISEVAFRLRPRWLRFRWQKKENGGQTALVLNI